MRMIVAASALALLSFSFPAPGSEFAVSVENV
jgi:hypothetical protein